VIGASATLILIARFRSPGLFRAVVGNVSDCVVIERAVSYPWHQLFSEKDAEQANERNDRRSGRAHAEKAVQPSHTQANDERYGIHTHGD
jgi:hypothetical protein